MRRFQLHRSEDVTGLSGTGIVAEGLQFTAGGCVIMWLSEHTSLGIYASIQEIEAIHGHGGKTIVKWIDDVQNDL
jgi:hypothetical protein